MHGRLPPAGRRPRRHGVLNATSCRTGNTAHPSQTPLCVGNDAADDHLGNHQGRARHLGDLCEGGADQAVDTDHRARSQAGHLTGINFRGARHAAVGAAPASWASLTGTPCPTDTLAPPPATPDLAYSSEGSCHVCRVVRADVPPFDKPGLAAGEPAGHQTRLHPHPLPGELHPDRGLLIPRPLEGRADRSRDRGEKSSTGGSFWKPNVSWRTATSRSPVSRRSSASPARPTPASISISSSASLRSPLARLSTVALRRMDGAKCLVPGDPAGEGRACKGCHQIEPQV